MPTDHGTFLLNSPDETIMLVQLVERAQANQIQPGHSWAKLEGSRVVSGRTEAGMKLLHVDLQANTLTITETWDGKETARLTVALASTEGAPATVGLVPRPEPGPDTPTFWRLPFRGADFLVDDDDARDWVMERASADGAELSVLPRRIRLIGPGFQEVVHLPKPFAPDVAPGTAATLHALSRRPGVQRRFVEGWFGVESGGGTAWLLEVGQDGSWWFAMRAFDRLPGLIGLWTTDWFQREGTDTASLPAPLRPLLVAPVGEAPIDVGEPRPPEAPNLGMFLGTLPASEAVPATAVAVANRVGRDWELTLARAGSHPGPRLTVFRGRDIEAWVLDGDFPTGLDDVIRAICARGETPASVALTRMGVVPRGDVAHRALITEGEAQGRRYARALLLHIGADDTILGHQLVAQDRGEVGDDGWIGVAPLTDMTLFTLNSGEA